MSEVENEKAEEAKDAVTEGASEVETEGSGEQDNLLQEEISLGGTPAGQAANEMLRALARAARSFLIYDPQNEAIRGFLQRYKEESSKALSEFGELILEIRPFEMLREGEVVYLERDRERSLAFRLFRDGVRKITIQPGVSWSELLRLLEVLSIRFTGIRQQEDDIVTLLLKSGFQGIQISAVEGFVPDDEEYCGDDLNAAAAREARERRREKSHVAVPNDWDLPLPDVLEPIDLEYKSLNEDRLEELRQEGTSLTLSQNTVRLVTEMLRAVMDPVDPTGPSDIDGLLSEARDFLLSEGQLAPLLELLRSLDEILQSDPKQAQEVFQSFVSKNSIRKILMSVPRGSTKAPPELIELLDLVPIDHLELLFSLLETERGTTTRRILRDLIQKYATDDIEYGLQKINSLDGEIAGDLFLALVEARPEQSMELVRSAFQRADTAILKRALDVLEGLPDPSPVTEQLYEILGSDSEDIRIRGMRLLAKIRDIKVFVRIFDKVNQSNYSIREAGVMGEILYQLNPKAVEREMLEWIKPRGMFSFKKVVATKQQKWVAISALALLDNPMVEKSLQKLRDTGSEEEADLCTKALYRRRKSMQ
ncbi:MAG: hypothetical protein VX278_20610 [Myxococcota bacterium]|nr:hypothetical protein [Myxococcota bacterium]